MGRRLLAKSVRHSFDAEMPGFACLLSQFEHRSNTDESQISGRVITEIEINSKKNARSSDCMYFKKYRNRVYETIRKKIHGDVDLAIKVDEREEWE